MLTVAVFLVGLWCRRSLGLVLVECLTGRYPFDASGGPMELIIHVNLTAVPSCACGHQQTCVPPVCFLP
jgi:hypothetical protein